jgi:hypothetical protein
MEANLDGRAQDEFGIGTGLVSAHVYSSETPSH